MRILITGASGNVGCGVVRALRRSLPSAELVGVCRRPPRGTWMADAVEWVSIDLSAPQAERELVAALRDVDVVVHLAVAVHPPRDTDYLYRANVVGSQAVWNAMRRAGVRHLVYASSLGVYGPGPDRPVDEHWPRTGQPTSTYSKHKMLVEQQLDAGPRVGAAQPEEVWLLGGAEGGEEVRVGGFEVGGPGFVGGGN